MENRQTAEYSNLLWWRIARFIGTPTVQGPGRVNLFGTPPASKLQHELDLAMIAPGMLGIVEAKDLSDGVGKNDIMIFLQKSFDYYLRRGRTGQPKPYLEVPRFRYPCSISAFASIAYSKGSS